MPFVKIVSFCTKTSIGSILQAYGLKTVLSDLGCKSLIIKENASSSKNKKKLSKKLVLFSVNLFIGQKNGKAKAKRAKFIDDNLDVVVFDESICANDGRDTVYIAGSDQIWNPDRCVPLYFLDFVKNSKKISYAASMGKTDIPKDKVELFKHLVGNIDVISVRERECADVIEEFTDKEVAVHIDPTFLIDAERWRSIEEPYRVKGKYILLYMLYWDPKYKAQIKQLKEKTGLPVYAICNGLTKAYADKYLLDVGVGEFLWLIDNAEYVVSSSFHGVALSTIFNKRFSAVINPKMPSRIDNLMNCLSVPKVAIAELPKTTAFDYSIINKKIIYERKKGIDYLKRNLSE